MVPRPAASVLPENLWQMQIFSFWRESETPGLRSRHLYFNKPFKKFWDTMKFEDQWQRWNWQTAYVWLPHKEAKWGISLDADRNHLLKRNIPDRAGGRQFPTAHSWKWPGRQWLTAENLFHAFWLWPAPWDNGVEIDKEAQKVWNTSNLKLSWRLGKTGEQNFLLSLVCRGSSLGPGGH